MICLADRVNDQMQCGRCGLQWDIGDPDPPRCGPAIDRRAIPKRDVTREVKRIESAQPLATKSITVAPSVVARMCKCYDDNGPGLDAMRAAIAILAEALP